MKILEGFTNKSIHIFKHLDQVMNKSIEYAMHCCYHGGDYFSAKTDSQPKSTDKSRQETATSTRRPQIAFYCFAALISD